MMIFNLVAAAMTLLVLVVLLPVLWRKDSASVADLEDANINIAQEQLAQLDGMKKQDELTQLEYDERKKELEFNLAASLGRSQASQDSQATIGKGYIVTLLVAIVVPVGAFFLYQKLGTPLALDPEFLASQQAPAVDAAGNVASVDELLPRLEAHLSANPDDLRGWRLLGVTYLRMQRFDDAGAALSRALELAPDDPDVMLQLADAKAMIAGGQLAGEPEVLVKKALAQRPDDVRGLWLLGMVHTQKNEHQEALDIWQRLSLMVKDEPEAVRQVSSLIDESRAALGMSASTAEINESASATAGESSVKVSVMIDPRITSKLNPQQRVFIYAKAVTGPPMPLAVVQHTVADLPLEIILDDSMAMVAGMNLSQFSEVVVGARVSLSGDPVASSGDFFAEIQPVDVGTDETVSLTIFESVP